jgi:hypothetical protein
VKRFLPYYSKEVEGKFKLIFIDECSFNLNVQGSFYGWGPRGEVLVQ